MTIEKQLDAFCEAMNKLSRFAQLRADLHEAEQTDRRRCGNCYWWMKSNSCPRERNVNGQNRGPSMNDLGCDKFQLTESAKRLKQERLEAVEQARKELMS